MSRSQRALFGGLLWFAIGIFLILRGWWHWQEKGGDAELPWVALAIGLAIGAAKGLFVLSKSSARMINRIENGPDRQPIWQMYPPYLYMLIPLMILFGWSLRHFFGDEYPGLILAVYVGIGAALIFSSPPFFKAAGRFS